MAEDPLLDRDDLFEVFFLPVLYQKGRTAGYTTLRIVAAGCDYGTGITV